MMTLLFLSIVVFLASFMVIFCVGTSGTSTSCANREHASSVWANTTDVGRICHPKPKKEILDHFKSLGLTKTSKKSKSKHPRYCEVCVDIAKKKLAKDVDRSPDFAIEIDQSSVPATGKCSSSEIPSSTTRVSSSSTEVPATPSSAPFTGVPDSQIPVPAASKQDASVFSEKIPASHHHRTIFPEPLAGWVKYVADATQGIYMKFRSLPSADPVIMKSVTINQVGSWIVRVFGKPVRLIFNRNPSNKELLKTVDNMRVCSGHFMPRYHALVDEDGNVGSGRLYKSDVIENEGTLYHGTIRARNCNLLIPRNKLRCTNCTNLGNSLRKSFSRVSKSITTDRTGASSHVPIQHLTKSQLKTRSRGLAKTIVRQSQKIKRLQGKLKRAIQNDGEFLNNNISSSLQDAVKETTSNFPDTLKQGSFEKLFWEQQQKAWKVKDPRGHRWHPMMIKWALNLRHAAPKGYRNLLSSGALKLPGFSTLQDYTHYTKAQSGFTAAAIERLMKEIKYSEREPYQKYVFLLHDEMKISSDLVYDKTTGNLVGFVDLGDTESKLRDYEQTVTNKKDPEHSLAKYMFVFMVRGLFYNFTFPIAAFPTSNTTGDEIFSLTWKAIEHLELAGFKVAGVTCDGAATNRRFFDLNGKGGSATYKTKNVCAPIDDPRFLYLMTDPPHLIKCVRNALANSFAHSRTRMLWNGSNISWKFVEAVFDLQVKNMGGLYFTKKLTYDHVHLTSYSKMKVSLAAEVISETVANIMEKKLGPSASATITFLRIFDKFFDCLNVRSTKEGFLKLKDNLKPYKNIDDPRFQWLKVEFLAYLDEWEAKVRARELSKTEQNKMMIPNETLVGLRRTANAFAELGPYLLQLPGVKFVLSERINQDPLESFFGNQRQMRGGNEAPNVSQFNVSMNINRIKSSHSLKVFGGNTKRKGSPLQMDDTPMPKKRRVRKK